MCAFACLTRASSFLPAYRPKSSVYSDGAPRRPGRAQLGYLDESRRVARHPAQQRQLLLLVEPPVLLLRARIAAVPLGPLLHGCPVGAALLSKLLLRRQPQYPQVRLRHQHAETQTLEGLVANEPKSRRVVLVVPAALAGAARLSPRDVDEDLPHLGILVDDVFHLGQREVVSRARHGRTPGCAVAVVSLWSSAVLRFVLRLGPRLPSAETPPPPGRGRDPTRHVA